MNSPPDPYQSLGVSRQASNQEISKAYKRLALQFHPDKNKSPEAETKFKEISNAYEVLSDQEKRQKFDRFGWAGLEGNHSHPGFHFMHQTGPIPDLFSQLFGDAVRFSNGRSGNQQFYFFQQTPTDPLAEYRTLVHRVAVGLVDMYRGKDMKLNINRRMPAPETSSLSSGQRGASPAPETPEGQRGSSSETDSTSPSVQPTEVLFKLTPGLSYHQKYQISGQGHFLGYQTAQDGTKKAVYGNLIIILEPIVAQQGNFHMLSGADLAYHLEISLKQMLNGFSLPLIHLDNQIILLESKGIADLSTTDGHLDLKPRLIRGAGMPSLFATGKRYGDLYLIIKIRIPDQLRETSGLNEATPSSDKNEATENSISKDDIPDIPGLDKKYKVKGDNHRVVRMSELRTVEPGNTNSTSDDSSNQSHENTNRS